MTVLLVIAHLFLATALLVPAAAGGAPLRVAATIFPVGDLVRQVGGGRVDVRVLLPPGASPHTFEPSPSQAGDLAGAVLLVQVGAGLEPWAGRMAAATGGRARVLTLADGIQLIAGDGDHDRHDHASGNPHVWLDPVLVMGMTGRIADTLADIDPPGAAAYRSNAAAFRARLSDLDADIKRTVDTFRIRSFVSFHAAWDYFARRYGLRSAGTIEESPGREPSPRQLAAIVAEIRRLGIPAVLAEPQLNPKPAEVIAREAGVRVVLVDPEGGLPGRTTYINLMRWNLVRMAEAMR